MDKFRKEAQRQYNACMELRGWESETRKSKNEVVKRINDSPEEHTAECGGCDGPHELFQCPFYRVDMITDGTAPPDSLTDDQVEIYWQCRVAAIQTQGDLSKIKCYRCGEMGHYAHDCKSERQTGLNDLENKSR